MKRKSNKKDRVNYWAIATILLFILVFVELMILSNRNAANKDIVQIGQFNLTKAEFKAITSLNYTQMLLCDTQTGKCVLLRK